ncbi:MAG: NAD-dependent malic enzyme, partial [Parcubacteria group bacterium]|nr:NAD-dependent malic enzyme [Parcubacteria group bacterium]
IPVMHDDQHGTAMVVLAGLINAFKVARVSFQKARIVIIGAGAAGNAITHLLLQYGARDVLLVDSKGIIHSERKDIDLYKKELAHKTNIRHIQGGMSDALVGADAVIGVSQANLLTAKHIRLMAKKSIVFAMSNPIPEIMPNEAKKGGAFIVATGRSDFQNQINNALCFPGIFRGALDHHVKKITHEMQIRAAEKLAGLIKNPTPSLIIPSLFDPRVVKAVANAIK